MRPNRHRKRWSAGEVAKLRLLVGHEPIERVAELLGRSRKACRNRLAPYGGMTRSHGLSTARDVALKCCVAHATVEKWCREHVLPAVRASRAPKSPWLIDPDDFTAWWRNYQPHPNGR